MGSRCVSMMIRGRKSISTRASHPSHAVCLYACLDRCQESKECKMHHQTSRNYWLRKQMSWQTSLLFHIQPPRPSGEERGSKKCTSLISSVISTSVRTILLLLPASSQRRMMMSTLSLSLSPMLPWNSHVSQERERELQSPSPLRNPPLSRVTLIRQRIGTAVCGTVR